MKKLNAIPPIFRAICQSQFLIKCLISSILLIFLLLVSYWLILSSNFSQYKRVIYEEINLKNEFEEKQLSSNIEAYRHQLISIIKKYKNQKAHLANNSDLADLLSQITQAGIDAGVVLEFFAPRLENKTTFFNGLGVYILVAGEYHKLVLFLSKISEIDKLITFENFEIYKDKNSKEKSNRILKMKIKAMIHETS